MLLLRGATETSVGVDGVSKFQYMLLLRGATKPFPSKTKTPRVSIHAPLARSNWPNPNRRFRILRFNTCSSCEEQHARLHKRNAGHDVSIHAPLARSNKNENMAKHSNQVSIHAPLARSNIVHFSWQRWRNSFNTCSSCEEQLDISSSADDKSLFQYMLLLRGATKTLRFESGFDVVSIHAPLARSNRSLWDT